MWQPPPRPTADHIAAGAGFAAKGWLRLRRLVRNERGVTALEYAFIAGLVAIAIVGVVTSLGTSVSGLFGSVLSGF